MNEDHFHENILVVFRSGIETCDVNSKNFNKLLYKKLRD